MLTRFLCLIITLLLPLILYGNKNNTTFLAGNDHRQSPLNRPQPIGSTTMVPFNSVFPQQGDRAISGNKMLAAMGAYLRGYHHYLYQTTQDRPFIFLHANNLDARTITSYQPITSSEQSSLFIGLIGTELFISLEEKIRRQELLMLFPLEGLQELRTPHHKNVIYFRPSHTKELEALIDYTVNTQHKTSIALFYEESLWGKNLLEASKKILKRYKEVKIVAESSYPQGTVEIEKAIDTISPTAPNAIICLSQARPAYTFIRHALNKKLHETLFLGLSELATIQSILKTALGMNIVVTSVVPHPEQHKDMPLIKEYKKIMQSFLMSNADSSLYLETFINFSLAEKCFRDLLQKHSSITTDQVIDYFETIKNGTLNGLNLDFNPQDRSLSSALWINPGPDKPWITWEEKKHEIF